MNEDAVAPEGAIQIWGARPIGRSAVYTWYHDVQEVPLRGGEELVTAWITPWRTTERQAFSA